MGAVLYIPRGVTFFNTHDRKNNPTDILLKEYKEKKPKTKSGKNAPGLRVNDVILREVIKEMKESLIEKEGGVLIKDFGYFFVWKTPKKLTLGSDLQSYVHTIQFKPVKNALYFTGLFGWTISRAVALEVKSRVAAKIRSGFHYRNYLYTLYPLMNEKRKIIFKTMQTKKRKAEQNKKD